jgi:hypothetical protein
MKTSNFVLLLFKQGTFSSKISAMKTSIYFYTTVVLLFLFVSCGEETKQNEGSEISTEKELEFDGKEDLEAKVAAIDNNADLVPANSLVYAHPNGSTEEATAFLDSKGDIVKLEERFLESETGNFGRRIFYIENGKRIVSKEIFNDNSRKPAVFVERHSFYDKKGKVRYSQVRETEFEENLEMCTFKMTTAVDCPIDRAMQIMNQEGHFETTFQGFVSGGEMEYLLVGENVKEGFTSSLAVQHSEGDIKKLMADQRAYVGKKLKVQFERVVDNRDMEFQLLLAVAIQ